MLAQRGANCDRRLFFHADSCDRRERELIAIARLDCAPVPLIFLTPHFFLNPVWTQSHETYLKLYTHITKKLGGLQAKTCKVLKA